MDEVQKAMWEKLCSMSGEAVARAFTNFHGNQLLNMDFAVFMVDEGYAEAWELGIDYEEEDDND